MPYKFPKKRTFLEICGKNTCTLSQAVFFYPYPIGAVFAVSRHPHWYKWGLFGCYQELKGRYRGMLPEPTTAVFPFSTPYFMVNKL